MSSSILPDSAWLVAPRWLDKLAFTAFILPLPLLHLASWQIHFLSLPDQTNDLKVEREHGQRFGCYQRNDEMFSLTPQKVMAQPPFAKRTRKSSLISTTSLGLARWKVHGTCKSLEVYGKYITNPTSWSLHLIVIVRNIACNLPPEQWSPR